MDLRRAGFVVFDINGERHYARVKKFRIKSSGKTVTWQV